MSAAEDRREQFALLHQGDTPLLLPNPWDAGSARLLAALGFTALATTSSGFAATLGRHDGGVTRDEALAHATAIVEATPLPVSADLENGFADEPSAVAATVTAALATGLAGCSIEDFSTDDVAPIYDAGLARDRVAAAAEVAHRDHGRFVLTARCENYLHGRTDLADTISRLQSYQEAGADVLFAPGVTTAADIASIVGNVDRPVNVLMLPGTPTVSELGALGVKRVSIGGALAFAAYQGLADAAQEWQRDGTTGFLAQSRAGRALAQRAFSS